MDIIDKLREKSREQGKEEIIQNLEIDAVEYEECKSFSEALKTYMDFKSSHPNKFVKIYSSDRYGLSFVAVFEDREASLWIENIL